MFSSMTILRVCCARVITSLLFAASLLLVSCTPVTKGYEIHTGEIGCDEANRMVHDALLAMRMSVTAFKVAKPSSPGYVSGTRTDNRGRMDGTVKIRCESDGVHITASQSGLGGEEFERGIFLSITGRAGLTVKRDGRNSGKLVKRTNPVQSETDSSGTGTRAPSSPPDRSSARPTAEKVVGVRVRLEQVHGYATLLDFEANLGAAGILPVRIEVKNGTGRGYEFDPRDVVLRRAGSRDRAKPLTSAQAVAILKDANRKVLGATGAQPSSATGPADALAPSELGDVRRAAEIMPSRAVRAKRLGPGESVEGFLYFPSADYDRARILMIDSATGETEGFLVEF
jgi:hypothetical protein